ncbi:hypothetical protein [Spirosoma areae]
MNKEKSGAPFGYEPSSEEVQNLILEWAKATEAFYHRYAKLTRLTKSLKMTAHRQPMAVKVRLQRLVELEKQMSDVLMTLLLDMSGQQSGRSVQPSKPGQLHSHASLMDELNRKIDAELISFTTVAQA